MEDPVFRVSVVSQQSCKLSRVSVHHCEVQGTEVLVEREVSKVIINVEEESVLKVLWRFDVTDPVQLV